MAGLNLNRTMAAALVAILTCAGAITANAEDFSWNTAVEPASEHDVHLWHVASNWVSTPGGIPTDGMSVFVRGGDSSVNPPLYTVMDLDIGTGVSLPNSAIRFDTRKTDIVSTGGGTLAVDTIAFNGAGGYAPGVYVPVIANTFSSNRHGAKFNATITVTNIHARSGHQDKWEINVSPTGTIAYVDLDENRNADGGSIDGFFEFNADTTVTLLDHTWSNLRVGAGATLTVGTLNYWDYTGKATDNNINPITLNGDLTVTTFDTYDVAADSHSQLAAGTYGRIGNTSVDNQVAWITSGDGTLTVIPEPATVSLLVLGGIAALRRKRR